ncbi:MAG TPA: glycine cleavage system H protein [Candidatus Lokiarchaeia archaeon]|nr:glycine cleavage system H protein [Candidatus Lokiarchaeia archaeon]
MADVKDGLMYTKTHQWAAVDGNIVTIGLTDYAQEKLGEISMADLNYGGIVGTTVEAVKIEGNDAVSDPIPDISVESSKAVGDIFSPVSGSVVEVNNSLDNEAEKINKDPYGEGWLIKVEASSLDDDLANLMDADAYRAFIESL